MWHVSKSTPLSPATTGKNQRSISILSVLCHHFRNWEKERENERGVTWDHIKTHQSINHVTKTTHLFTTQNPNSPISFPRRRCFFTLSPPLLYSIQLLLSLSLIAFHFEFSVSWFRLFFLVPGDDSSTTGIKKKVEDVVPIATGHEREEIQAQLEVSSFNWFCYIDLVSVWLDTQFSLWLIA